MMCACRRSGKADVEVTLSERQLGVDRRLPGALRHHEDAAIPKPLPANVPMPPVRLPEPLNDSEWIFESKLGGFRAVAYVEQGAFDSPPGILKE